MKQGSAAALLVWAISTASYAGEVQVQQHIEGWSFFQLHTYTRIFRFEEKSGNDGEVILSSNGCFELRSYKSVSADAMPSKDEPFVIISATSDRIEVRILNEAKLRQVPKGEHFVVVRNYVELKDINADPKKSKSHFVEVGSNFELPDSETKIYIDSAERDSLLLSVSLGDSDKKQIKLARLTDFSPEVTAP